MIESELATYLTTHWPRYKAILRQMIEINSFTTNIAGVNHLGMVTAELFASLGFSAEAIPSVNPEYGNHQVLTRHGTGKDTIGFVSHLDTVFSPEEEMSNRFSWREEGDRIYGPGTIDIKGGTLVIFMMLESLKECLPGLFESVTWVVLLNSSEECGSVDFTEICYEKLPKETLAVLVFEAGFANENGWYVVNRRKGMARGHVLVSGRSSHAGSRHEAGANAIVQLAEVVQRLAALSDYEKQLTVNVGTIQGGTVVNRVPHEAKADFEMRAFDMSYYRETIDSINDLEGLSSVCSQDGYCCKVTIDIFQQTPAWSRNAKTEYLMEYWKKAAQKIKILLNPQSRGGLSDANGLWRRWPTLDGLGPQGGNAHCSQQSADGQKEQEFVNQSSFIPKTILNNLAVIELLYETERSVWNDDTD